MIQSALPHVMHCCAALLYNRKLSNFDKLGAAETKLLYTLHWIILDAAEECADAEFEQGIHRPFDFYLLNITTIEVFIYLFAPLLTYLRASDFLNCFRLENGYKIWTPIMKNRHPEIPSFIAHARPKKSIFSDMQFERKAGLKFGGVFVGGNQSSFEKDGPQAENTQDPKAKHEQPEKATSPPEKAAVNASSPPPAETRRMSFVGPTENLSKPREDEEVSFKPLKDPLRATYMDVATVRCLFLTQWIEEGVDWALKFLYNRLIDMRDASAKVETHRPRSNSLTNIRLFPADVKCRTTTYLDNESEPLLVSGSKDQDFENRMKDLRRSSYGTSSLAGDSEAQSSDSTDKKPARKKKSKRKQHLQTDTTQRKDSSRHKKCEWHLLKKAIFSSHEILPPPPRPGSSLGIGGTERSQTLSSEPLKSEMIRGKSMPSLHLWLERRSSSSDTPPKPVDLLNDESEDSSIIKKVCAAQPAPRPIITITEHSPISSIQFFGNQDSVESAKEDESPQSAKKFSRISRSQSLHNVCYRDDILPEATGSRHFVLKDGSLNILTVLSAVHSVTLRDSTSSLRNCDGCYKILKLLLDMDILKRFNMGNLVMDDETRSKLRRNNQKEPTQFSVHNLFVDSLMFISKHLGCPHGCNEGLHGPQADGLRKHLRESLLYLFQVNELQFIKYFRQLVTKRPVPEMLDLFHAFVGFCTECPASKKHPLIGPDGKTAYTNNFGAGFGKIGPKGVEGVIMNQIFKSLVTRMVKMQKELKLQENLSIYCELRQLVNFIKDNHGGIFRKVALSALLDSQQKLLLETAKKEAEKLMLEQNAAKQFPFGEEGEKIFQNKKSFIRKKGSNVGIKPVTSSQSMVEDEQQWSLSAGLALTHSSSPSLLKVARAASPRLSITDDEALLNKGKTSTGSKFPFVNWLKGDARNGENFPPENGNMAFPNQPETLSEKMNRRQSLQTRKAQKTGFMKGARKRVEDQFSKLVFGKGKSKPGSIDENIEMSRKNSFVFETGLRQKEVSILKEARLISLPMVKNGIIRFSFLLETCTPGSLPDPPLLAALLDLRAPVIARAAFYLECANFIHSCNRGQWPSWMKLTVPLFRPSGPGKSLTTARRGSAASNLHRAAGRMFYQWAEAIGARLEELEALSRSNQNNLDDQRKRQLRLEDEEEDFLDENSVNPNGNDCPFALKMAATQVLYEITTFLRETHQYIPTRTSRTSISKVLEEKKPPEKTHEPRAITANRRWSMALSSLGFSQNSAHSLISLAEQPHPQVPPPPGERRISFVLHEADGEVNSIHSSNASGEHNSETKRPSQSGPSGGPVTTRPHLLRRATGAAVGPSGGSFKRRSLKLKKGAERKGRHRSSTIDDSIDDGSTLGPSSLLRRGDSCRSKGRRVSGISERSDLSGVSGDESPGVLSDDGLDYPVDTLNADDADIVKHMPWIKVIINMLNNLDYECPHQYFCRPNCYRRHVRACSRMISALKKVYAFECPKVAEEKKQIVEDKEDILKKEKKLKKIMMGTAPTSPVRRKPSMGHNIGESHHPSHHSSATYINHSDPEAASLHTNDPKRAFLDAKTEPRKEDLQSLKYIKNQVKGLFHNPLSILLKSTLILPQHLFIEQLVLAWEFLLVDDQHLAATAAVAFIVSAVKCPEYANELLHKELQNDDPAIRITAIIKFYAVWRARYQCWPRMEEGAHLSFKVPPPTIEFTLPSPKIALETMPVADPPWMPQIKTKVEEVTINQEQSVQKSFVTATKTRRKQQIEMVQKAIEEEQEKMREEREVFRISAVPVNLQASYEPALFHTVEEHEEVDDDQAPDKPVTPHIQVSQAMFPSCLCTASMTIINLLDDPQVSVTGSAVYEVAYKVIWHCLVEDTTLFLRHFFEKLTKENQKEIFQILRRLIRFMPRLPAQAAYTLYNYLIGFVMYNVRTPSETSQHLIGDTLSVLWLVVPSVHGLFLKDLKQILRKEQCDATLLITANVPSAKKIIVHGPDVGGIPSQFPIQEDTQFSQILIDSLDFFGIDDSLLKEYYLVDAKTSNYSFSSIFD